MDLSAQPWIYNLYAIDGQERFFVHCLLSGDRLSANALRHPFATVRDSGSIPQPCPNGHDNCFHRLVETHLPVLMVRS